MSSENQSSAPSVQSSLNTSEIASNEQTDKSMLAITRLRDLLAAAFIALADAIEQNQPEDTKNQIRLTIAVTEDDLAILISAHTHLLRSGPACTEQIAPQSRVVLCELPVLQWQGNDVWTISRMSSTHTVWILMWTGTVYFQLFCQENSVPGMTTTFVVPPSFSGPLSAMPLSRCCFPVPVHLQLDLHNNSVHNNSVPKGHHLNAEQTTHMSATISFACPLGSPCEVTQSCERSSSKRCLLHGKGSHDSEDCHIPRMHWQQKGAIRLKKPPT
ncbi:hypothetical protein PHYBLDRAFT_68843 [Phycomyces blakesleeanus NRRL 1555(-)]|uniref:Uncharacterized protein n=1 Tax=Phycomyces blakesleeanus (strain ATCC 8743b / DSM 1359 / FGSC 10004 / NBRC 33097 / NRRL 1555) TaxID=763407 RepID=A0A162ND13_PHYB8|nr:hypothetical protein PHYBLDRAFT_68843 [Phycomyces blakesleeanus NRRL 1555(-)]OAD68294.1 hypothetical protein PHYBLDRAFT_68843 [Phycomyces blakesleeanus NRRL 1555(-)]|eukprot:XP_018286334.1 hypothetical protein PHYBLDRAFT_68843 [Phycomyces blakesleeanus NRRL 1555(-)]